MQRIHGGQQSNDISVNYIVLLAIWTYSCKVNVEKLRLFSTSCVAHILPARLFTRKQWYSLETIIHFWSYQLNCSLVFQLISQKRSLRPAMHFTCL